MRARFAASLKDELTVVGRTDVSRAISDLERARLVSRHCSGCAANHTNRGGGYQAVYVVKPTVLRLLRRLRSLDKRVYSPHIMTHIEQYGEAHGECSISGGGFRR